MMVTISGEKQNLANKKNPEFRINLENSHLCQMEMCVVVFCYILFYLF